MNATQPEYIVPLVVCGKCFNIMDISEWLKGWETDVGDYVPHPAASHRCDTCGYLWEPENNDPGDLMTGGIDISGVRIMFFWDFEGDSHGYWFNHAHSTDCPKP